MPKITTNFDVRGRLAPLKDACTFGADALRGGDVTHCRGQSEKRTQTSVLAPGEGACVWHPLVVAQVGSRALLLTWDVRPDQEEPWRRLLQELSEAHWQEEHVAACRRLGLSVESIWFVPKMGGGGTAVVYLEAEDPERTLRELVASETLFEQWGIGDMGRFFGFGFSPDSVQASRVVGGELLFSWRDGAPDER